MKPASLGEPHGLAARRVPLPRAPRRSHPAGPRVRRRGYSGASGVPRGPPRPPGRLRVAISFKQARAPWHQRPGPPAPSVAPASPSSKVLLGGSSATTQEAHGDHQHLQRHSPPHSGRSRLHRCTTVQRRPRNPEGTTIFQVSLLKSAASELCRAHPSHERRPGSLSESRSVIGWLMIASGLPKIKGPKDSALQECCGVLYSASWDRDLASLMLQS